MIRWLNSRKKKLQRLCGHTNDEKYLKRKHNGHVIELKRTNATNETALMRAVTITPFMIVPLI